MPSQRSAPDISSIAVVIPVKAFHQAKERLSDLLTPTERFVLAKYCADRVVEAARQFETYVVCDDADVAQWARDHNVMILPTNFDFEFCYGKNSFLAHQEGAKKIGLSVRVIHDQSLAVDIDTADDLAVARQLEN